MDPWDTYVSSWRQRVGQAISEHRDVISNLIDAREYHGSRSFLPPDDRDADHRRVYVEIPLLWGTF
jgi:hypothetical protein